MLVFSGVGVSFGSFGVGCDGEDSDSWGSCGDSIFGITMDTQQYTDEKEGNFQ